MRDMELMARTLRQAWEHGRGEIRAVKPDVGYIAYYAGEVMLNGQAVRDLVNDGWIDEWPGVATLQCAGKPEWMLVEA